MHAARRRRAGAREHEQLLAGAGAELDELHAAAERAHHLGAVALEQPRLGPRDRVPGELADRLEELRAERVVKVFRWEDFWSLPEASTNVVREALGAVGRRHDR